MTTSGTYSFSVTRDDIIRDAMLNIGKIGETEIPTPQETVDCARKLNMLVKQWQAKADFAPGLKVWTNLRGDCFLSNSIGQYSLGSSGDNWTGTSYNRTTTANAIALATTITVSSITNVSASDYIGIELDSGVLYWTRVNGAPSGSTITLLSGLPTAAASGAVVFNYTTKQIRPERILTCVLRDINFSDVPIEIRTLEDYESYPNKADITNKSDPIAVYYEAQLNNGQLYTDVGAASDVTKWMHMVFMSPIQDFTNPTDNPFFPQNWYLPLTWGLSKQIAPMFNSPWTQEMESNYTESLAIAREQYPEYQTLYFQPGND